MSWLYVAFAVVWAGFILYVVRLIMTRRSLERDLGLLEEEE